MCWYEVASSLSIILNVVSSDFWVKNSRASAFLSLNLDFIFIAVTKLLVSWFQRSRVYLAKETRSIKPS